jgi:hypothetical protein
MKRLVCTDSFADEKGNVVRASHYGIPEDFPLEMALDLTFEGHWESTMITRKTHHTPGRHDVRANRRGVERIVRQAC